MSARITNVHHFCERLIVEGPTIPITWLIGAGFSASAGIPLASEVSKIIVLFEYLIKQRKKPWSPDEDGYLTYLELSNFLDWYFEAPQEVTPWHEEAEHWISQHEKFQHLDRENPNRYPALFRDLLLNTSTHSFFLTTLIQRMDGVNLAHYILAGILRDFPEWGHTVFTTNFDDLLLNALLTLNYTGRIFGDLESKDIPSNKPSYPQIVHLHGRHTGYRLSNTKEQISLIDPEIQRGFLDHIHNSHLVVIGYSGWDDLVMKTLRNWPTQRSLVRGNLFWVPFLNEEEILKETKSFLDQCPPGSVDIIVSEDRDLDADKFMLLFCDVLARTNGGFASYRREISDNGIKKHQFVLNQLRNYERFNPKRAFNLIDVARKYWLSGDIRKTKSNLNSAKKVALSKDLPDKFRANVFFRVGQLEEATFQLQEASESYQKAASLWVQFEASDKNVIQQRLICLLLMSRLVIRMGNMVEGEKTVRTVTHDCYEEDFHLGMAFGHKILADLALRKSQEQGALKNLTKADNYFQELDHGYGLAVCALLWGCYYQMTKNTQKSELHYQQARDELAAHGDHIGVANALRGLASLKLLKGLDDEFEEYYDAASKLYQQREDNLGKASLLSMKANLHLRHNKKPEACTCFLKAIALLRQGSYFHELANALYELLQNCRAQLGEEEISVYLAELRETNQKIDNGYAKSKMGVKHGAAN